MMMMMMMMMIIIIIIIIIITAKPKFVFKCVLVFLVLRRFLVRGSVLEQLLSSDS